MFTIVGLIIILTVSSIAAWRTRYWDRNGVGFGRRGKPPNCSSPSWQTLSSQTRRGHSCFNDNDTLVLRSVLYRKTQLSVCSLLINIMKMTTTMTTMMMHSCRILSVVCSASLQKLSGDKTDVASGIGGAIDCCVLSGGGKLSLGLISMIAVWWLEWSLRIET